MKKRFTRIVETFQVEMPLEMYVMLEDSINYQNRSGHRILTGADLVGVLEQNGVDYENPKYFFYCNEDMTIFDLKQMIRFCLEGQEDVDYEFDVRWRPDGYFTDIIRDKKLTELL